MSFNPVNSTAALANVVTNVDADPASAFRVQSDARLSATFAPVGKTVFVESFRNGILTDQQIITAAFAALPAGGCLKFGQGITYVLTAGLFYDLTTKPDALIDGQGATIDGSAIASGTIMQVKGGSGAVSTTLAANVVARTTQLTVASTAGFATDDVITLRSSGEIFNPDRAIAVKQELCRVKSVVNGTTLALEGRTWNTYSLSGNTVTVQKIPMMRGLRVADLRIVGAGNGSNQSGLRFVFFDGLRLSNITVEGAGVEGLAGRTGLDWTAINCRAQGSNRTGVGYGFHVVDAQQVKFISCMGRNNRHSFDVDEARDVIVDGCSAVDDSSAGISTHGSTDTVKFVNNTTKDCGGGIVSRGKNTIIQNNDIVGSRTTAESAESYVHGMTLGDGGSHTWGVGLAGIGLTIVENRIDISGPDWTGAAANGIYCTSKLIDAYIHDNRITGYSSHAIYSKGDGGLRVRINDNRLDGSGQLGVYGSTFSHGIFLSPSHAVAGNTYNEIDVKGNSISYALHSGIRIKGNQDDAGEVSDNIVICDNTIGDCGVARVSVSDGYYGYRIEIWGNEWLGIAPSASPISIAAQSFYLSPPFVGVNGWASKGIRFLGDGQQMGSRLRTGLYYGTAGTTTGTGVATLNRLYAVPFYVDKTITLDRIAVTVTVAAAVTSSATLGVYADVADGVGGYPGALLGGSEVTVATDVAALAVGTISVRVTPGLYWLAGVAQGAAPTWSILSGLGSQSVGTNGSVSIGGRHAYTQDSVTGVLPTTFSTAVASQGGVPVIQIRIA